jgi:AcrR family transcriptional regulator
MDLASAQGLEPLSIGALAEATGLSKAGLYGHFGSKEDLQIAVVNAAGEDFTCKVIVPARDSERGLDKLLELLYDWMDYTRERDLRGGCFFAAAAAEFDDRPGPVRDAVAFLSESWIHILEREARAAIRAGELYDDTDPMQMAFELHALPLEANWGRRLFKWTDAYERAELGIEHRLRCAVTPEGRDVLERKLAQRAEKMAQNKGTPS